MLPILRKLAAVALLFSTLMLQACTPTGQASDVASATKPTIDSLVTANWLNENRDDPNLIILDCSVAFKELEDGSFATVSGKADYEEGHIPGAAFADLLGELSDADSELKFAVPSPEAFAAAMGALGVGDNTRVVLYDSYGSTWAARVWWMLRWVGFDQAALLDGGLQAWTDAGFPVSTEPAQPVARTLTANIRPGLIVDSAEVQAAIGDDSVNIIDALPEEHYRGEQSMYGRPGHIPGATNVPVMSLKDDAGRFLPQDELVPLFDGDHEGRAITYCGGGIAASTDAFVMVRLGYKNVAVYTASLQEWAADPSKPLETGDGPE